MQNATGLSILTAAEVLASDVPPRSDILTPLLAADGAALVYGPSGIGKSFFALGIAWAVASGGSFLGWQAPQPERVLYVDGELGIGRMRERLALFGPPPERLAILPHDLNTGELLDLSEEAGIVRLMAAWNAPRLLVLDSRSTLVGLRSGDVDGWGRVQRFLLHQRMSRRAVLMVDHVNKHGELIGTTRRENAFDLMLALRRPELEAVSKVGAPASGNACFEIHCEKTQHRGALLTPILAELETDPSGCGRWRWEPAPVGRVERVASLLNRGLNGRQAADALGIGRTLLFELKAEAAARGLLNRRMGDEA